MKNNLTFTIILLFLASVGFAQNKATDIGLEVQVYPTGFIPGVRFEKSFTKKDLVTARLGYQIIDHKDKGKHDDETGSGVGGSAGYKHYFNRYFTGPSLGVRADFWANKIDWKNNDGSGGETKINVVQPTIEAGWALAVGENMIITPTLSFGFEINVRTQGQETGEGAIILVGILATYRLN